MIGLERTYRRYLDCLNARRFDELGSFVHEELTYNDEPWTLARYREARADEVRQIPDLRWEIADLVVSGDRVAARLRFDVHPTGRFLDVDADGRRIVFAEHVFYRFERSRIVEVYSLLDVDAIRRQLGRTV